MGDPDNLWAAGVGFRVSPVAEGIDYRLEVELGGLPRAFHTAIEETVRQTLHQGLYGWEIPNCRIDLTHTAYSSVGTSAADFRRLVPLVLMQAIAFAGTTVLEPLNHFELDIPPDSVSRVLALLADSRGLVTRTTLDHDRAHLEGTVPAATTHPFEAHLPGQTHGEGILTPTFTTYHPVPGTPPARPEPTAIPSTRRSTSSTSTRRDRSAKRARVVWICSTALAESVKCAVTQRCSRRWRRGIRSRQPGARG